MGPHPFLALATAALLAQHAVADGLYTKGSPVIQVSGTTFDTLINKSNYTSLVEFYAPWCGHCQDLKPIYEKVANSLNGLAKVAAINCDDESNKPFCSSMGVSGFPTLKIVKPGKKVGKPAVETYRGPRKAKDLVDAIIDKIPNHVKRLQDDNYQAWLDKSEGPKAILFSSKGLTSALLKAIAIDFLDALPVAHVLNTQKAAVAKFGIEKYPTLVLIPGKGQDPLKHTGDMKKEALVKFLSQAVPPNPEPVVKLPKKEPKSSKAGKSEKADEPADGKKKKRTLKSEDIDPKKITKKMVEKSEQMKIIPTMSNTVPLQRKCLNDKAGTCILAFVPNIPESMAEDDDDNDKFTVAMEVLGTLSSINHKQEKAEGKGHPFYRIPPSNPSSRILRKQLEITSEIALIATNGKRGWYRRYTKNTFNQQDIEDWIESIRMGSGGMKEKFPENLIVKADEVEDLPREMDNVDPDAMKQAFKEQMPNIDFADFKPVKTKKSPGQRARDEL